MPSSDAARFHRRAALACACIFAAGLSSLPAAAQTYPDRPIRLIVPFGPAGAADNVARLISDRLGTVLGQSVVVENKPGADGVVGMQSVATAKPDGYTLLLNVGSAHTLTPLLVKTSPDPVKAFEPVSLISKLGFIVVVNEKLPVKTFQDYVAYVRANPARTSISSGSSGVALISEKFKRVIGAPEVVVASYKGPGFTAVLSGEVDMTIDAFNSFPMITAGKLRPLAVLASKRLPSLPDVPTMDELGVKGMDFTSWGALFAPAGTPAPIVDKLHKAVTVVMADPAVRKRFTDINHEVVAGTPAELAKQVASDLQEWRELVQSTGYRRQ